MKKEIVKFLVLLMVAMGAGPVGAAFWQWSTTASTNGAADPTINFSEGMSPSAVNDSARAMMAALAVNRITQSGITVVGGTSSAYTLSSGQSFTSAAVMDGAVVSFTANPTSVAGVTLNVDSTGAFPLVVAAGSPVPDGGLIVGVIYDATFINAISAWKVHGFFANSFNIPLGGVLWSTAPTAPNANFVAPSGQCISTTTYATYWVQQGSPASGACPGGQFAILDMRGMVPAALDTLNGVARGILTSSGTGCGTAMTTVGASCANGTQGVAITLAQLPTGITSVNAAQAITVTTNLSTRATNDSTSFQGGANPMFYANGSASLLSSASGNNSISVTSNNTSGTATPRVQPTIGLIPYLRIL